MRESLFEYLFWIRFVSIIYFFYLGNFFLVFLIIRYSMIMCLGEIVFIFCVDVIIVFIWNIFNFLDIEV